MRQKMIIFLFILTSLSINSFSGSFDGITWYNNKIISHIRPNIGRIYFKVSGAGDYLYIQNDQGNFNEMATLLMEANGKNDVFIDFHTETNESNNIHKIDSLNIHRSNDSLGETGTFNIGQWYADKKIANIKPVGNSISFKVDGSQDYMYIANTHQIYNAMVASLIQAFMNNLYIDFHTILDVNINVPHEIDAMDVHD